MKDNKINGYLNSLTFPKSSPVARIYPLHDRAAELTSVWSTPGQIP